MTASDWCLTPAQRRNPLTWLDTRRGDGLAHASGNLAVPLVHGATYFAVLHTAVQQMRSGDLLLFTDWRGNPDQRLTEDPDSEVATVLAAASRGGVDVRGPVWRSHLDALAFSGAENRHLGELIEAAGGECLLDMRVRSGGSQDQKFIVLRHPGRPELDIAFVGGIDLCHSRRDDAEHGGDAQSQPMAQVYGPKPAWHDGMVQLRGPVVGDVETVFRERCGGPPAADRQPAPPCRGPPALL